MPRPLADALTEATALAGTKSRQARSPGRYLLASALAGVYVGVAVVLLVAVSAPFVAAGSPATKLVQGAVFGVALTLVVFAGAELFTGNAMVMLQGLYARRLRIRDLSLVWAVSLLGNLVGSVAFAALVHGGGTLSRTATSSASADLVAALTAAKTAATGPQLLWRAVLCNMLVCLALWMASRATTDGAKLAVLWWALLAFISSGFEHSVANMTLYAIGVLQGSATWLELARNLAWTVPGNVLGGGVLVGLGYAWLSGSRPAALRGAEDTPAGSSDLRASRSAAPARGPARG
jgi:nitrite transporter